MAEPEDVETNLVNPGVSYERQDVGASWLVIGAVSIFILTLIGIGASAWILGSIETRRNETLPTPLPLIQFRPTPPAPRLQPNPIDRQTAQEDIVTLEAQEEEILKTYGWVDREAGKVRIPIEQAIEMLAEDGAAEPSR